MVLSVEEFRAGGGVAPIGRRTRLSETLNEISSIVEASHDLDDLLTLLLDQILHLMHSDTAAILLLDKKSDQLIARAARGLEEEVRQGVRIPVGTGFAGRIAADRRPQILDRIDASTVANPILWEKGIRSMLGVPLVAGETLIGVLHVGSFGSKAFDESDVVLLEVIGRRVGEAVEAGIASSERRAAGVLQRSLLPSALPKHPHIEFASRYAPAERGDVGGDWYDAFELPSGDVWVMTGDITGHGLNPAITMGRLRSAMRAYALLGMTPEDVLRGANRKLLFFEPGAMATVVCGVLSPPFDEIRLCSAGHPPPVLVRPGHAAILLKGETAPPLGVVTELEPHSSRWSLTEKSVLVLYTDGLVERRGEAITEGLERLRTAVRSEVPERLCGQIMDDMIGSYVPADDVALLALRVTPQQRMRTSTFEKQDEWSLVRSDLFACHPTSVRLARRFIVESVELLGLQRLPDVQLMVSELATNAVRHAKSQFDVVLEKVDGNTVRVEVRDFGRGAPTVIPGGTESTGGRGLKIVDLLAQTWGVENRPAGQGKTTWFVVAMGAPPS
jgi:anti-sigma regulatory factor (Ser/Thr protein kinase)/putative methionine-R-sulfoxide reductase with GAF domain